MTYPTNSPERAALIASALAHLKASNTACTITPLPDGGGYVCIGQAAEIARTLPTDPDDEPDTGDPWVGCGASAIGWQRQEN